MNHRRIFAALVGAGSNSPLIRNSISSTEGILDKFRSAFAAARHTLALIGLAALAALALVFFRPYLLDEIKELSPFASTSLDQERPRKSPSPSCSNCHNPNMPGSLRWNKAPA